MEQPLNERLLRAVRDRDAGRIKLLRADPTLVNTPVRGDLGDVYPIRPSGQRRSCAC